MNESTTQSQSATPPCPHFGVCGGCQLQHLAYEAQLQAKAARLRELLGGAGVALPELQVHASPPLGYRNRIRLTLGQAGGQLRAGYIAAAQEDLDSEMDDAGPGRAGGGAVFLPITQCPIAAPVLWRAAQAFLELVREEEEPWLLQLQPDQLELFTTADESRLQMSVFLRAGKRALPGTTGPLFTIFCEALRTRVPELTGAGVYLLPAAGRSRRVEMPRPGPAWGSPGLSYAVGLEAAGSELTYWVPRGAFFQVNRFLLPEMVAEVDAAAKQQAGALAWDLYAGVGLFSRVLARHFGEVIAVEGAESSFGSLASGNLRNVRAIQADTLNYVRAAAVQRDRPGLVVLDPPRTGAGSEVCQLLGRIAPRTIVYVSCSPSSLPADLATLAAAGYTVNELHLFDLFPQTAHMETVVILRH